MRPGRNAHGPRRANVFITGLEVEIVVEDLRAVITTIRDINIALGVGSDRVRQIELARLSATFLAANLLKKPAILVVLHDSIIAVTVRNENVPLRIPRDIGRTAERILLGGRRRTRSRGDGASNNLGSMAEHHHHAPLRIELDDQVGPFVDDPDVVLGIDAHRVRELKAVKPLAYLAQVFAVLVELEKAGVGAARVDKDVPLGIGGYADCFAQVQIRGEL